VLKIRKIDSYHFGFFSNLTDSQLRALIGLFHQSGPIGDSVLGGRTAVTQAQLNGIGAVIIKHYRRGGLMRYVVKRRYLKFGKTRAQREFELLAVVDRLGLNVPRPIAFAYRGSLLYRAWLVTREIHQPISLARLSLQDEKKTSMAMESVIEQIVSLIQNNVLHVDLHPGNVVVDAAGKVYLLDFDKGTVYYGKRRKLINRYLTRWQRAVNKYGLPKALTERMRDGLKATMAEASIKRLPPTPSILIILMGSLGDIVRALCLVSPIKLHLPQSRISWLVEERWAELIRINSHIDNVIVFQRKWRFTAIWQLYQKLNHEHFDIVLDLQRIFKSGVFSFLSGAKRRIGLHRSNTKELNWLFNTEYIPYYREDLPKLSLYLKFLEQLGLPEPVDPDFGFSQLNVNALAPPAVTEIQDSFIAVVMGSSWETKDWYFEGYCQLVQDILRDPKMHVVLLGDNSQTIAARRLSKKMNSDRVINLTGNSLVEMTAVLKAAAAGVGPDSGPGHLAAAVGTPYVTLFGPTPPGRHAPYGCEHLVVQSLRDCLPCYKKRCPDRNRDCMYDINPTTVMEMLTRALSG
jgi:ADP-heptose:LPS heptosyltransferase/tRNA A-37 threonylcarbamoyl transferase component Bud32